MGGRLLEECRLFDVFTGQSIEAGRKSLALSLSFRHADRTLTDVEIEKVVGRIMQRLERDFDARLRDR
jgi:phenylalanyl-tRNA synthetase beta chain